MMRLPTMLLVLFAAARASAADDVVKTDKIPPLGSNYGFLPPEIYRLDRGIKNLILRDVNADGRLDAVILNPAKNRIDLLLQRKDPNDRSGAETPSEPNELVNDWRLKHVKVPAQRQIDSIEVVDLNGDKLPDIVYIGEPSGLFIEFQRKDGSFGGRKSFDVPDVQHTSWAVDAGDLNGDGKTDIAFLGKENLYVAYQKADGQLDAPIKYRLTDENPGLLKIADVDGDGKNDIVYIADDPQFPVRARFQSKDHRVGPERRFAADKARGVTWAHLNKRASSDLLLVSDITDRLQIYRLSQPDSDDPPPTSQIVTYPFEKSGSTPNSDLVVADFSGDGMADVVVSDSGSSRLFLYRQLPGDGLDLGTSYPATQGIKSLRAVAVKTAEKLQLLALSDKENVIGVATYRDGRLSYPQPLTTRDEPMAMEIAATPTLSTLYYIARSRDMGEKFALRKLEATIAGNATTWQPANFGANDKIALELAGRPSDMRSVDANGDGIADLLVLFEFQAPTLLVGAKDGSFAPSQSGRQNNVGEVAPAGVFFEPIDGPKAELLLAQGNFARKMQFADGRWKVLDAINASDSNAAISGIAALDLDADGKMELAMYDRTARALLFFKKTDGVYRQWKQLKVGAFVLRGMRVADFDRDGKKDLLLFDGDKMGIVYTARQDLEFKQIASYETTIRGAKLDDVAVGDLSGQGRSDLLLIDMTQHNLEIVTVHPDDRLERALRWPVFEEKTFRQNFGGKEPREAAIGDLDGDGKNDIAILVHNRMLVYLQDAGKDSAAASNKPAKVDNKSPTGGASGR